MSNTRKLRAGRIPGVTASTWVGDYGIIFYDEPTGALRVGDGVTPGGKFINPPIATSTQVGGFRIGPGINVSNDGLLTIDTAGLPLSFGDFFAFTAPGGDSTTAAWLSSVNANEDIIFSSNGEGSISVIGKFNIYPSDGSIGDRDPVFGIDEFGQVFIYVSQQDMNAGAVEIIGTTTRATVSPGLTGSMLHITGQLSLPNRTYLDGNNEYVSIVGRRWNGNVTSRTQVLADEYILRINATAQTNTTMPSQAISQILFKALENQTNTAQGSNIEFVVTPVGQSTANRVTVANITVANGVSATKFTGPLTGNVTGDISGNAGTVTNGVYTTGSYSDPSWLTISKTKVGLSNVENTALSTSTHYIGTTSIQYNRASASQTLNGVSIDGNAATVTNGVYTTGSYSDPSWLTISKTKVGLSNVENTALSTWAGSSSITTLGTIGSLTVTNNISSSSGIVSDSIGNLRSVPINGQSGAYNLAASDNGKMVSITTGGVSVLQNVFASPYGQIISIFNNSNSSQTITQGAGVTLRLAGTASTGNRTLARYGVATITCVAANTFVISGAGIT